MIKYHISSRVFVDVLYQIEEIFSVAYSELVFVEFYHEFPCYFEINLRYYIIESIQSNNFNNHNHNITHYHT